MINKGKPECLPGMTVICIKREGIKNYTGFKAISYRETLTVRSVFWGAINGTPMKCLRFEGIDCPAGPNGFELGYNMAHFIPYVDKPLPTSITRLLNRYAPILPMGGHLDVKASKSA
jgi:hypothetical protein